ncbi:CerR family C-terminal domain-containing protein [Bradyrhizobium quebecense]|uniref:CerR family C-terminal domain-containing protein n=2 Tax=Bradyrhizobium quebecense TaxID=2748629 RepID=A0A973WY45_9BRAD|nr:CerR family C-terminal domain-containing protein [Bradyrhizobium quebecense]UGA42830.1 CerR family C-terminal domain-containing protein [Bradyrhizobium quebecense]UGX99746.1 CerR family C-terminal domain-containing protein [Bradyrhizobium quebecense]
MSARNSPLPPPTRSATTPYKKGDETRDRILNAALAAFGDSGFAGVTTRRIAEDAGINLPALNYYFGNKEGLYLACAHEILARYRESMAAVGEAALASLEGPPDPDAARAQLKLLLTALARFLLTSASEQNRLFVQRELADPGRAFEVLYAGLWRPGIELVAQLIIAASKERLTAAQARVRAVMMIAGLTGFQSGAPIISRTMGKAASLTMVIEALEAQVDALAN